ncbi:MAG: ATP-binding protein [Alphaproteobacteria bacterium]|nr:ATP-binding protein [Alphaproteobacteria bacterium]OJV44986.1 MAG: AAA family ATPase [Alphaproteobacteria bacterium 43-37]
MYIKRFLEFTLPPGQSCFLWGARQTGKSTYLKSCFPNATYVDLLQADVYQSYLKNPSRLREEILAQDNPSLIVLDEVQKVPLILDEVHSLIESQKNLQFILCGSSARRLKSTGANLLGGRAWRYHFLPLCYPELKTLEWVRIFNHGLLPSHYVKDNPQKSLAAYLFDYLLTEVQFEANLRKRDHFAKFLEALGFCHGELINYSNIARDCGIDSKTVRTYFEILEDMYLGYFLTPYRSRINRQTIQETPKFYLFDTGVANYLKRYEFKEFRGSEAGKSFEHYIFLELMAYKQLNDKREALHFWRTKEGYEVDFIVADQAIEVKIVPAIEKRDLKGLLLFGEQHAVKLNVVCLESKKRVMSFNGQEVTIWPVQNFLDTLWGGDFWV